MAVQPGYADIPYADNVNSEDDVWLFLSDDDKNYALSMSRMYIDTNYSCAVWEDPYPDELLISNSLLASEYANDNLFEEASSGPVAGGALIEKMVKAGSVESMQKFSDTGQEIKSSSSDRFPEVSLLLSPFCTKGNSGARKLRRV